MSQKVTITSITANTPVDVYYCDSMSASCVFVSSASTFPFEFYVPSPYDEMDFTVKVMDSESCVFLKTVYITPTQTPSQTQTPTPTNTQTPTNTTTQTTTPSQTPTNTQTPSNTPSFTPTQTTTPIIASHLVGKNIFGTSGSTCLDTISSTSYFTYISEANLIPVSGATIYQYSSGGSLSGPLLIGNSYIKMKFDNDYYVVQVNPAGEIINFQICP